MGDNGITLHTKRTVCRPLSKDDFEAIFEMYVEPDSNKFIAPLLNKSMEYYQTFLEKKVQNNKTQVGFWSIYDAQKNELIGTANLNSFQDTELNHIGCHLKRGFWGQGYAFEVLLKVRDFGFKSQNLTEIYGIVEKTHSTSKKLIQKLGFVEFEERSVDGSDLIFYINHRSR